MKLDLDTILRSEPFLPYESGEDNEDLDLNGMNFDIAGRLRKLFSFIGSSSSKPDETDAAEHIANTLSNGSTSKSFFPTSFLKRKADEKENSDYQVLTKYRKIDTEFPKVIHKPFEDESKRLLTGKKAKASSSMPAHTRRLGPNGKSSQPIDPILEAHYRQVKKPTAKVVTFADAEYSDDDMDDLKVPKLNAAQRFMKPQPPLPALIQKKTGEILASSIIPRLNPIRKVLTASSSNSSINRAKEVSFLRYFVKLLGFLVRICYGFPSVRVAFPGQLLRESESSQVDGSDSSKKTVLPTGTSFATHLMFLHNYQGHLGRIQLDCRLSSSSRRSGICILRRIICIV